MGEDAEGSDEPERRSFASWSWVAAHAGLWLMVGAGAVLLFGDGRTRRPRLAEAADQAAERLHQLELTPAQQSALDAIRNEWRDSVLQEEKSYGDRIFFAAQNADLRIEALLTDAQRAKYRELSLRPPTK